MAGARRGRRRGEEEEVGDVSGLCMNSEGGGSQGRILTRRGTGSDLGSNRIPLDAVVS